MQQKYKKVMRPNPWFNELPTTIRGAASSFSDIITMLENYRPATLMVAAAPKNSVSRSIVEGEIRNLAYELNILRRAFGIEDPLGWEVCK